jgi:integrative and conjugative element protein (TIGR02256 family)
VDLSTELADIRIWESALPYVVDEAGRSRDGKETGGILIGMDDGDTVDIRYAAGPGPSAIRRFDLISRDTVFSQQFVNREWRRDGSDWIGEWHTHTVGRPVPSKLDRRTYMGFVTAPDLGFRRFFSLILSADDQSWEELDVVLWEVDRKHMRPRSFALAQGQAPAVHPEQ